MQPLVRRSSWQVPRLWFPLSIAWSHRLALHSTRQPNRRRSSSAFANGFSTWLLPVLSDHALDFRLDFGGRLRRTVRYVLLTSDCPSPVLLLQQSPLSGQAWGRTDRR